MLTQAEIEIIRKSIESGFVQEPEWVKSDVDFIRWVRLLAEAGKQRCEESGAARAYRKNLHWARVQRLTDLQSDIQS